MGVEDQRTTTSPALAVVPPRGPASVAHPEAASPRPTKRASHTPKWEADAQNRLRSAVRRYRKLIRRLMDEKAAEAETRKVVTQFLHDGLGFDLFNEIDAEYRLKVSSEVAFADLALFVETRLVAFVEVKRVSAQLSTNHRRQVFHYAFMAGVPWVILTNARMWQLYHVEARTPKPAQVDLVLSVDLLADRLAPRDIQAMMTISREHFDHDLVEPVWRDQKATSPRSITTSLLSRSVLKALRTQLHADTRHLVPVREIEDILRQKVLRPEMVDGRQ